MNRSHIALVLSLAVLPSTLLLAGCPDEKRADVADSSPSPTSTSTSTMPAATMPAAAVPTMSAAANAPTEAGAPAPADAGRLDATVDAAKAATKK